MSTFPILLLPQKSLQNVLRIMQPLELIYFSFVSKTCKAHTVDLNLKASRLTIVLKNGEECAWIEAVFKDGNTVGFEISTESCADCSEVMYPVLGTYYEDGSYDSSHADTIKVPTIGLAQVIAHFQTIFHKPKISQLYHENVYICDQMLEIIKTLDFEKIEFWIRTFDYFLILFSNYTREVDFQIHCLRLVTRVILCRSIRFVDSSDWHLPNVLASNGTQFKCSTPVPIKSINMFLRHWTNGSNPRLECIRISIEAEAPFSEESTYIEEVLKGIHYQTEPIDSVKTFDPINLYTHNNLCFNEHILKQTTGIVIRCGYEKKAMVNVKLFETPTESEVLFQMSLIV